MMSDREITREQAMSLMEAMCHDSAEDFRGGVLAYIKADADMKKARHKLDKAFGEFFKARERKYNALCVAMPEYSFFRGKEGFDPGLDAKFVISQLIKGVLDEIDDDLFIQIPCLSNDEDNTETKEV